MPNTPVAVDLRQLPADLSVDRVRNTIILSQFLAPPTEGQLWPRGNMAQGRQQ